MATLAPLARWQFSISGSGVASGYKLFTYESGTTTKKTTYTNSDQSGSNTNPIILDSNGSATIFLNGNYKFVLAPPNDTDPPVSPVWTVDNVQPTGTSSDIFDENGNIAIKIVGITNAVNYISITNAALGNDPKISVGGSDGNIDLDIQPKGTGDIRINDSNSNEIAIFRGVASAVNEILLQNNITGNSPIIRSNGESNQGISFHDSNNNEILKMSGVASAVDELTVKNSITSVFVGDNQPTIEATGSSTNIYLGLKAKGVGNINILPTNNTSGRINLFEASSFGSNFCQIKVPDAGVTQNRTLTLADLDMDLDTPSQSTMQTGTSNAQKVSPGTQHYHDSASKCWIICDAAGTTDKSYNVTSITDTGTGQVTITINVDFDSVNYVINATAAHTSNLVAIAESSTIAAGSVRIETRTDAGTLTDPTKFMVSMFGRRAT